jgi:hypothetical protein
MLSIRLIADMTNPEMAVLDVARDETYNDIIRFDSLNKDNHWRAWALARKQILTTGRGFNLPISV